MNNDIFSFIREHVDIVDVVSRYVTLRPAGSYLKGLSPFKAEKTPSFTVTPHRKIFYCFSSSFGGDVIDFVSRIEQCSQIEAAKKLIEWYQLKIPEHQKIQYHTDTHNHENKLLFEIHEHFATWCIEQLHNNQRPFDYIKSRIYDEQTMLLYRIGYCPSSTPQTVQLFLNYMLNKNILADDLIKIGILQKNKFKKYFFTFDDRIVFPIINVHNLITGFGGRIYESNDKRAKYVNSHASHEFSKKDLLFGIAQALSYINKEDSVYVVEGYFDVINLHQIGYKNVVATMGTACTEHHITTLHKIAQRIILMYDGDEAGKNAIYKFIGICCKNLISCEIIKLNTGVDPGILTPADMADYIKTAQDGIEYLVKQKTARFFELPPQEKLIIVDEIIKTISISVENPLQHGIIISSISQKTNIPVAFIEQAWNKHLKKGRSDLPHANLNDKKAILEKKDSESAYTKDWWNVLVVTIFNYNHFPEQVLKDIHAFFNFAPQEIKTTWKTFLSYLSEISNKSGINNNFMSFFDILDNELKQKLLALIVRCDCITVCQTESMYKIMKKKVWAHYVRNAAQNNGEVEMLKTLRLLFI